MPRRSSRMAWGRTLAEIATLAFGGEGRRGYACSTSRTAGPNTPAAAEKPIVLLTTPGLFQERWKPRVFNGRLLRPPCPRGCRRLGPARGGLKPNRFAAQAGSVYFLNQPLTRGPKPSATTRATQQGWGCYLKGVWTDA